MSAPSLAAAAREALPGAPDTALDDRDIDHSGGSGCPGGGLLDGGGRSVCVCVYLCVCVCFDAAPIETGEPN